MFPKRRFGTPLVAVCLVLASLLAGATRSDKIPSQSIAFTPPAQGNGLIAFVASRDGNNEIYSMNPVDGTNQVNLTNATSNDTQPAWSPDGTKIAFTTKRGASNDVFVMNADGSSQTNLTNFRGSDTGPTWSPDGLKIAFTANRDGNNEIYVMNADGTAQTNLTINSASDSQPAWSPDGLEIAFTSNRGGNNDVWVMNADGTAPTDLTPIAKSDSQPTWSPSGAKILFTSARGGNNDVWEMNADGTGVRNLTNNAANDQFPIFSRDSGTRVIFTTNRDGNNELYIMNELDGSYQTNLTHNTGSDSAAAWQSLVAGPANGSPIEHVVIIYQENHSFDNVLGYLCATNPARNCEGATTGQTHDGTTIDLTPAADIVPVITHTFDSQVTAIAGGAMNGFDLVSGCTPPKNYACYTQFHQNQIPNIWDLAMNYTISDHTFELDTFPTWGSHLELVTANGNGYNHGDTVPGTEGGGGIGRGCESKRDASWQATPIDPVQFVPTCIPDQNLTGPYKPTPVPWEPTIWDRLDGAGVPWRLYAPIPGDGTQSYGYSICPTFAECVYGPQHVNHVMRDQFLTDAADGTLPSVSIVIPVEEDSQHNNDSMIQGDNYIASRINAVMNGPDWATTAIFLTWDDCGCFYDHMPPPPDLGIREPMIIISPFAKPAYTDKNVASFPSMMAYIEHRWGLAPLSLLDQAAYDYADSFDYTQRPLAPIALVTHKVPRSSILWVKTHPNDPDEDPT